MVDAHERACGTRSTGQATPGLPYPTISDPTGDREHEEARQHPERETLELAAAGAARVLGHDNGVTQALAKAAITMAPAELWKARLAVKTLRRDQREAITEVAED